MQLCRHATCCSPAPAVHASAWDPHSLSASDHVQVFCLIIIIELFGSPFMRSAALVFALLIGTAVAAVATVDGKRFFNGKNIASAPAITFLWTKRFPLGG